MKFKASANTFLPAHGVFSTCATLAGLNIVSALANPAGMAVTQGFANAINAGPNLTIQASGGAVLNWSSFNIAPGETTRFVQPDASSIVWNNIKDANPSQVFGNLHANGVVVLANQNGFYFGPNAFVKAGGLLVTTAPVTPPDFSSSNPWNITYAPPAASIINYGRLETTHGGSIFLIADHVENHGSLSAPAGQIGLFAGKEVLLSERPDGRGISASVELPTGSVDNRGILVADAGAVALHAKVVNQQGVIQANSVRERAGVIELIASDVVRLDSTSVISAQGDSGASSPGGRVEINSAGVFTDQSGSTISVGGGIHGGDGGQIHLSAPDMPVIRSALEAAAAPGAHAGSLRLDPKDILLSTTGDGSAGSGTVPSDAPPETLRLDINTAFAGFSEITLQATRDITLDRPWLLSESTGVTASGSQLTLQAGRDIRLKTQGAIFAGENWSVNLAAGYDFTAGAVQPGVGGIFLEGNSRLETLNGGINLTAGKEVSVRNGYVHTIGGGSIHVEAMTGNLTADRKGDGFEFAETAPGYTVLLSSLGGISTGAGGDVTIKAGGDVKAYLPTLEGNHSDGGSGAFGGAPGNVTISAGGSVLGHFVLANGTGVIEAGADAGRRNDQLALSLVKGSWTVRGDNIALQEVRNPNGIFNSAGPKNAPERHRFDYDPAAKVVLEAADTVEFSGLALPRNPGVTEQLPIILPPSLKVSAGAGGIILNNDVTLFPSAQGDLKLTTRDGGALRTSRDALVFSLVMSDSDKERFTSAQDFGPFTHGKTVLHADDAEPARLDIAGNVRDLLVAVPKAGLFTVGGDMINTSFVGQNLKADNVTEVTVAGQVLNRNNFTFAMLDKDVAPDRVALATAVDSATADLLLRFSYNPVTGRLAYANKMTQRELDLLLNLQSKVYLTPPRYDEQGNLVFPAGPLLDDSGAFLTQKATFLPESVLKEIHTRSQDIPDQPSDGFQVGGPGLFTFRAAKLDLGISKGIVSLGPKLNHALAAQSARGADLQVEISGDITMFSSAISSVSGGAVSVRAGGSITVGDPDVPVNSKLARGIYSVGGADVSVIAGEDILVSGSRIGTYDGGDVLVRSERGDVDAGVGALGFVRVERVVVDEVTKAVETLLRGIPGSGILATTYPDSPRAVGDIVVETPQGNIIANNGGVLQVSINGVERADAEIRLSAGTRIPGGAPDGTDLIKYVGDIDAGSSGVIGGNIQAEATGDIKGVLVARNNITIDAHNNANVTAVASGTATLSAGGTVSGTVVAIGGINTAGSGSVTASLLSQNVVGNTSGQSGFSQTSVSSVNQPRAQSEEESRQVAAKEDDEEAAKRAARARPMLTRTVGRVTVILPSR